MPTKKNASKGQVLADIFGRFPLKLLSFKKYLVRAAPPSRLGREPLKALKLRKSSDSFGVTILGGMRPKRPL
jgi:hypothetical protein